MRELKVNLSQNKLSVNFQNIATQLPIDKSDWHEYFFGVALMVSARADCTRRQFGCVVVSPDKRIVGTGYPGPAYGEQSAVQRYKSEHGCYPPKGFGCCKEIGAPANSAYDNCNTLHAENLALSQLGTNNPYEYLDLYLVCRNGQTGDLQDAETPCIYCSRTIKQYKVRYIYSLNADSSYKILLPKDLVTHL